MQPDGAKPSEDLNHGTAAWEKAVADTSNKALSINDFELGRTIGKGRFARVRLAKLPKQESIPLCLKILKKSDICRLEQVTHVINEKDVLASSWHPFIVHMLKTFQDCSYLYMALELVNGGELFTLLRSYRTFKLPMARFYIAEMVSAIYYLHEMLIVYRDVKPENIMIHRSGHLKLTDFGFAKYLGRDKTFTICGTAAYMAPEIVKQIGRDEAKRSGYGLAVDWWGVGILFFEMIAGRPPFDSQEEEEVFRMIVRGHAQYPPTMERVARDFTMRLLMADPARRLGSLEASTNIREHTLFANLDWTWEDLEGGRVEPPWRPGVSDSHTDTSRFETFEESGGGGRASTGSLAPGAVDADAFADWARPSDRRAEALALARELRQEHERRLAERRAREEADAEAHRLAAQKAREEKTAPPEPVLTEKPSNPKSQSCCTLQ